MKTIRTILGKLILLLSNIFAPKGVKRSTQQQSEADSKAQHLTLYHFSGCPFCIKVERELKRQSINIAVKDAANDPQAREELLNGGGKVQVPCLKITSGEQAKWLYESSDIIAYLKAEFA